MLNPGLVGKTVAITGASSAFGQAIAHLLGSVGARVFGCDLSPPPPPPDGPGVRIVHSRIDLLDRAAAAGWVRSVEAESGGAIDILVHNAGGPLGIPFAPLESVADSDWDRILGANLGAAFAVSRAAVPAMKRARSGRIITITSGAGLRPSLTGLQAYASAKHAMVGLTRQLAAELGPHGITVNSVAPGLQMTSAVKQARWDSYGPERQARILEGIALRRLGTPEDIARAVLFFASDLAGFVTGEVLSVSGGTG